MVSAADPLSYHERMFKFVKRWDKCLNADADYMEK
jgi:hypothetical protein